MSLWIEEHNNEDDYGSYFSIKTLQQEAKLFRTTYKLHKEPIICDMSMCYLCKKKFLYGDTINFYSDTEYEYCYHQNCPYTVYKFEKKKLVVADLQDIINQTRDIDFSNDNIIPANIYKLNLIQKYRDYNLDLSQSKLQELIASDYDRLDLDNFKSIVKLECYRTLVDFSKFTNLTKLKLERPLDHTVLSCINLIDVVLRNIDFTIDFTDCINLKTLTLINIDSQIIIKNCINLEILELNNVNIMIDVSDCTKLQHLRLENMMNANIMKNISSLTNLHINNVFDTIDVSCYPNIKTLSCNVFNNGKGNFGKCVVNYERLEHLEVFLFSDMRFMDNIMIVYCFDFTNNTKLKNINIYSAINNCNINISNNLNLEECTLEFYSDNPIYIPKNVKKLKFKNGLNTITNK